MIAAIRSGSVLKPRGSLPRKRPQVPPRPSPNLSLRPDPHRELGSPSELAKLTRPAARAILA